MSTIDEKGLRQNLCKEATVGTIYGPVTRQLYELDGKFRIDRGIHPGEDPTVEDNETITIGKRDYLVHFEEQL